MMKKFIVIISILTMIFAFSSCAAEEKSGEVSNELANSPKASLEYAKELSRIAKKMTDSMY